MENNGKTEEYPEKAKIEGFPARLKIAIGDKSVRSFAKEAGLSPTVLHKYLAGQSEPTRLALIAMAKTARVGLNWLASGDGSIIPDSEMVYIGNVENIIEAYMEYLEENKYLLPPYIVADEITMLIVILSNKDIDMHDRSKIKSFLNDHGSDVWVKSRKYNKIYGYDKSKFPK